MKKIPKGLFQSPCQIRLNIAPPKYYISLSILVILPSIILRHLIDIYPCCCPSIASLTAYIIMPEAWRINLPRLWFVCSFDGDICVWHFLSWIFQLFPGSESIKLNFEFHKRNCNNSMKGLWILQSNYTFVAMLYLWLCKVLMSLSSCLVTRLN